MDYVEMTFRSAGDRYRRAEQHLADAENSLRKLLARFLVAEIEKPKTAPVPVTSEPLRETAPDIWGHVEELLAARRMQPDNTPEPAVS